MAIHPPAQHIPNCETSAFRAPIQLIVCTHFLFFNDAASRLAIWFHTDRSQIHIFSTPEDLSDYLADSVLFPRIAPASRPFSYSIKSMAFLPGKKWITEPKRQPER
jgi:hypothetical protein